MGPPFTYHYIEGPVTTDIPCIWATITTPTRLNLLDLVLGLLRYPSVGGNLWSQQRLVGFQEALFQFPGFLRTPLQSGSLFAQTGYSSTAPPPPLPGFTPRPTVPATRQQFEDSDMDCLSAHAISES